MRIAVWHNLPSGGGKRALHYHLKGLRERGHKLTVFCPDTNEDTYLPLSGLNLSVVKVPLENKIKQQGRVKRKFSGLKGHSSKYEAFESHCKDVADRINSDEEGFDVLFANSDADFYMSPLGTDVNIPSVVYLQEPNRAVFESFFGNPWLLFRKKRKGEGTLGYMHQWSSNLITVQRNRAKLTHEIDNAKGYNQILVNSYYSRESVLRAYGAEASVCYLGVDVSLFQSERVVSKSDIYKIPYVVCLGSLKKYKGTTRVLNAFNNISKDKRPKLIWIGNASTKNDVEEMENYAKDHDINLEIYEMISDEDLISLLSKSLCMIYVPYLEPFGFAPLEANACGVPVIAYPEGGMRETIQDGINGWNVRSCESSGISERVLHLLQNPEIRMNISNSCRSYVETEWSLKKSIDTLEKYLMDLHYASLEFSVLAGSFISQ